MSENKGIECTHEWRELTSNEFGVSTSYQCIRCLIVYDINPMDKTINEYMAQKYDLVINRMNQNHRQILRLNQISKSEGIQLVIDFLNDENKRLLGLIK